MHLPILITIDSSFFSRIEAITLTALDQDAMGLSSALPMEQAVFRKLDYGQVRRWPLGEEECDKSRDRLYRQGGSARHACPPGTLDMSPFIPIPAF